MAQLQLKRPIAFFDLETTGVDPVNDRIVEIAIVRINPDGTKDKYLRRINPGVPIPKEASAVHHIYDEDVADEPAFKQLAHEIRDFLTNCDLGGYNSNKFDVPCLAEEFLRAGVKVNLKDRKMVDVQQIFFKMEPRTLSGAYKFYCGKNLDDAHSALADTEATVEVLESQVDKYPEVQNDIDFLHSFTGGNDLVDYARRIIKSGDDYVFNFGKYKGKPVEEVFKKEPQYYDWMMQADFSADTKQAISEILNHMLLKNGIGKR